MVDDALGVGESLEGSKTKDVMNLSNVCGEHEEMVTIVLMVTSVARARREMKQDLF